MIFEVLIWFWFCRKLKIGNKHCGLKPLIGCSYGSLFLVETGPDGPLLARVNPTAQGKNLIYSLCRHGFKFLSSGYAFW